MPLFLFVFVDDSFFVLTACNVDEANEKRNFVLFVERIPNHAGKFVDCTLDFNLFRLALKAWQGISVTHVCVDKVTFAFLGIVVSVCEAEAVVAVSAVAL